MKTFNTTEFVEKYNRLSAEVESGEITVDEKYLELGAEVAEYYDTKNENHPVCKSCVCETSQSKWFSDETDREPEEYSVIYARIVEGTPKRACWSCSQGLDETYEQSV